LGAHADFLPSFAQAREISLSAMITEGGKPQNISICWRKDGLSAGCTIQSGSSRFLDMTHVKTSFSQAPDFQAIYEQAMKTEAAMPLFNEPGPDDEPITTSFEIFSGMASAKWAFIGTRNATADREVRKLYALMEKTLTEEQRLALAGPGEAMEKPEKGTAGRKSLSVAWSQQQQRDSSVAGCTISIEGTSSGSKFKISSTAGKLNFISFEKGFSKDLRQSAPLTKWPSDSLADAYNSYRKESQPHAENFDQGPVPTGPMINYEIHSGTQNFQSQINCPDAATVPLACRNLETRLRKLLTAGQIKALDLK
ncbi:MAG: hypothetical protein JWO82_1537, partial [Akkermansiaceae bacterium]|nr:hypothetical protein [Akkermansiaceae bacterium]